MPSLLAYKLQLCKEKQPIILVSNTNSENFHTDLNADNSNDGILCHSSMFQNYYFENKGAEIDFETLIGEVLFWL